MREGAVRVRHAVRVFALLDRVAAVVGGIHQFARETGGHGGLRTAAGGGDEPADGERLGALRTNLDRHLVGRTADAARTHLDLRGDVLQGGVEHAQRIGLGAGFDGIERTVDDALGNRLLPVVHEVVHELRQDLITELRVRQDFPLLGTTTTRHSRYSLCKAAANERARPETSKKRVAYFGRLAPYFERLCLRSLTPCVSSTPRSTW